MKYKGLAWAKEISRYELRGLDESIRRVLKKKEEEIRENIRGEVEPIGPIIIEKKEEIQKDQLWEDLEKLLEEHD